MYESLKDKVIIITGGAGVLCAGFAGALAACGARVAVADLSLERARGVADALTARGYAALAVEMNVLDAGSVRAAYAQVKDVWGACDILINGAGGNHPAATSDDEFFSQATLDDPQKKSVFDIDPAAFGRVLDLNLLGAFIPTQIICRDMATRGRGVILNISSMNAYRPLTKIPAYSAAKAGLSNLTQWLAVHFAKDGVRVNAIAPGFFSTAQNKALLWNADGTPTARTGKILAATPMGRFGVPDDLTGTLLYLLDDTLSGFVTGVVVPVDGGFSAYSGV